MFVRFPVLIVFRRTHTLQDIILGLSMFFSAQSFSHVESIRFFDDIELLRQRWQSANAESVAELWVERTHA
jgi:hypothetical protein